MWQRYGLFPWVWFRVWLCVLCDEFVLDDEEGKRERVRKIQRDEGGVESEEKRRQGDIPERKPIMLKWDEHKKGKGEGGGKSEGKKKNRKKQRERTSEKNTGR